MNETELMNALFNGMWDIVKYDKLLTDTHNNALEIKMPNGELFKIEITKIEKSALTFVKYFG